MDQPEDTLATDRPPSLRRSWLKRLAWSFLALLVILVCTWAVGRDRQGKRLQEALAELDRDEPGWRLNDIEDARERVPFHENSAPVVVTAVSGLPKGWPPDDFSKQYADLPPQEQLGDLDFKQLKEELDRLGPALRIALRLADMPHGRYRIEYQTLALGTGLNDQAESRRVVSLLFYDALRQGQKQDLKAALRSCRATLNAGRSLGDEPFAISQILRTAGVIWACRGIERTLAQGEPAPEDLAALQPLLREEDAFADLIVAARGERALLHESFTAFEKGLATLRQLGLKDPGSEGPLGWLHRPNFVAAHATILTLTSRCVAIAQMSVPEQIAAEKDFDTEIGKRKKTEPIAVMFVPALNKMGDTSRRKHAYLRCTDAALACERYRREHKQWPASLDSLCPRFLPSVPLDPFDGKPLRYQRLSDGIRIYSVSSDGADNGGNIDRQNPTRPGADVGLQLWNVAQRRQPPRPRPKPLEAELPPPPPGMR